LDRGKKAFLLSNGKSFYLPGVHRGKSSVTKRSVLKLEEKPRRRRHKKTVSKSTRRGKKKKF